MTRILIITESILVLASILFSNSLVTWRTNGLITDIRWQMCSSKQRYKQLKAISFPFSGKNGGKLVEIPSELRSLDNAGVVLREKDSTRCIEVSGGRFGVTGVVYIGNGIGDIDCLLRKHGSKYRQISLMGRWWWSILICVCDNKVFLDALVEIGSRRYVVGHPCDWAVSIGKPGERVGYEG